MLPATHAAMRHLPSWAKVERPIVISLLLALAIGGLTGCSNDWRKTDRVVILSEQKSPDGKFIATAFECEGGGAAGYYYANVNVRRAGESFNQRDYLLGKMNWSGFGNFGLKWLANDLLEVTYRGPKDPKWLKQNGGRKTECKGVRISYAER